MRKSKTVLLIITVLLLLLAFPTVVFANGPAPDPYAHELLIDDVSSIDSLTVYGIRENGGRQIMIDFYSMDDERLGKTAIEFERIIHLYNEGGRLTGFQLDIALLDGEKVQSDIMAFIGIQNYAYSVNDNDFYAKVVSPSRLSTGWKVVGWIFALVLPLGLTILLEWLVALIFKIKPSRYVCFTNLISNPLMNIIIIFAMSTFMVNYFILVLILELIVFGFEFLYYTRKYKDISKKRLLLFTIAANAVSFGTYAIISGLFH